MRNPERIDNFLSKVDYDKLFNRWVGSDMPSTFIVSQDTVKYWEENPDQRIGQVLINLGLISDSFQAWNDEEDEILEAQGLQPEEYLFWTSQYDKDKNLLDTPITRLISDLDTDHIIKIIELFYVRLAPAYKQAFANVLIKRDVHGILEKLPPMSDTLAEGQ